MKPFLRHSLVGLAALLFSSPAFAGNVYGRWQSNSGNVFDVAGAEDGSGFHVYMTSPTGQRMELRGRWIPGLVGTQFEYWDAQNHFTGTFNPHDGSKIRISNGKIVNWWQREGAQAPTSTSKVTGFWSSTTGNVFSIAENGEQIALRVRNPNGAEQIMNGSWVPGLRGTQFQYSSADGATNQGTFNPSDPNRVRIAGPNGVVSWWTRTTFAQPPVLTNAVIPVAPTRTIVCWQNGDSGCSRTKGGHAPMDKDAFASLESSVQSASPNTFMMVERIKTGVNGQYLTSRQLTRIISLMKPNTFQMLEAVKIGAPHLVDPQNGAGMIAQEFSPNTFMGTEATKIVSAQRAD